MPRVHTVVMHIGPHLDEIVAFWLLVRFGQRRYPGIQDCKIQFTANGARVGQTSEDLEKEGYLLLGTGDKTARFNDHRGRKAKCAAELVAEALGIRGRRELGLILTYAHKADLEIGFGPFELASLIQMKHNFSGNGGIEVVRWAIAVLDEFYEDQVLFWKEMDIELRKARFEQVGGWSVVVVDDVKSPRLLRGVRAAVQRCAVLIQRQSSGNVQIFCTSQKQLDFRLFWVAGELRRLEDMARYGEVRHPDGTARMAVGILDEGDPWYLMEGKTRANTGVMLLNGSLTHPDIDPTFLKLDTIVGVVTESLKHFLNKEH